MSKARYKFDDYEGMHAVVIEGDQGSEITIFAKDKEHAERIVAVLSEGKTGDFSVDISIAVRHLDLDDA